MTQREFLKELATLPSQGWEIGTYRKRIRLRNAEGRLACPITAIAPGDFPASRVREASKALGLRSLTGLRLAEAADRSKWHSPASPHDAQGPDRQR